MATLDPNSTCSRDGVAKRRVGGQTGLGRARPGSSSTKRCRLRLGDVQNRGERRSGGRSELGGERAPAAERLGGEHGQVLDVLRLGRRRTAVVTAGHATLCRRKICSRRCRAGSPPANSNRVGTAAPFTTGLETTIGRREGRARPYRWRDRADWPGDLAPAPWAAPRAAGSRWHARVAIPGSKSLTNRALVLAGLGARPVAHRATAAGARHRADDQRAAHDRRGRRRWLTLRGE